MVHILVTGGNGQVAQELSHLSQDFPEFSFTILSRPELDITNRQQVQSILNAQHYDYVINTAAFTKVDLAEKEEEEAYAVNAYALQNLGQLADGKIIHLSTDYVYHGKEGRPLTEKDPVNPQSIYGKSKLLGEKILAGTGAPYLILRTSWVYSPYGNNFVKIIMKLLKSKSEINVVNDQIGSPTYAHFLVKSIVHIIQSDVAGLLPLNFWNDIYNLSDKGSISWYELASAINNQLNYPCIIHPIPTVLYPTPAKRPPYSVLDISKLKQKANIEIQDWSIGLEHCLERLVN